MWVYPDFFTYRGGIYRRSEFGSPAKGFHSVRLIGWGEESFGARTQKYWVRRQTSIIQNHTNRLFLDRRQLLG